ncbi:DUF1697 domain-containing protein [Mycobacterium sp. UM_Kg1]|uniref:DUF1697 domain-containing protein n=1 Tax=Mycobacterium sp. UM_Kg1 TaxID=1545691 RepID=UPI00061B30CE|nr:DUF1697 domain-containing protein [Mycobacterium sp. UM_Kg1]
MSRYALFLRGVNVGGIKLKMPDVAAALRDAGFDEVRTLLATGNVLVDSPAKPAAVRATAESALRQRFDYQAWVLVYDVDTVREIVAAYPFEAADPGLQSYVTFVSDDAVLGELAELTDGDEKITPGDGVLYWQVPKGDTLTSPVGKTMGVKRYQSATTTRNLRTLHKVLDSAGR